MTKIKNKLLALVAFTILRALSSPCDSLAQANFGETADAAYLFGEMFTPQQNITISGANLQATGYFDNNFSGPQSASSLEFLILNDSTYYNPNATHEPAGYGPSGTATIDYTTGPNYDLILSQPFTMDANTPYWFVIWMEGGAADGSLGVGATLNQVTLDGDSPSGIVVDGYAGGQGSIGGLQSTDVLVPMDVGVVPEASVKPMYILGWVLLLFFHRRIANGFRKLHTV